MSVSIYISTLNRKGGNHEEMVLVPCLCGSRVIFYRLSLPCLCSTQSPIKIGVILALTGPSGAGGIDQQDGVLWAAEAINAAGGVKGRPLKLIFEDDAGDPTKAVLLAKKLITVDKVSALIGTTRYGAAMALIPVTNELKVPIYMPIGGDAVFPGSIRENQKFTFVNVPESRATALLCVSFLTERLNAKRVGILQQSGVFYDSMVAGKGWTKEAWDKSKAEMLIEKFEITAVDFTAQLLRIKSFKPDALYVATCAGGTPPPVIVRQAKQLLPGVPIVINGEMPLRSFLELAGDAADGVFYVGSRLAYIVNTNRLWKRSFSR